MRPRNPFRSAHDGLRPDVVKSLRPRYRSRLDGSPSCVPSYASDSAVILSTSRQTLQTLLPQNAPTMLRAIEVIPAKRGPGLGRARRGYVLGAQGSPAHARRLMAYVARPNSPLHLSLHPRRLTHL